MAPLPDNLIRICGFSLYVLWLVAFPMAGPLLDGTAVDLPFFLWPHAIALLACVRCGPHLFTVLLRASILASACITLFWHPLHDAVPHSTLFAILGLLSGPFSIQAVLLLKNCPHPIRAAATGLVIGNLALLALNALPLDSSVKRALLAGMLTGFLLAPGIPKTLLQGRVSGLYRYLPFVFLFQLLSGLMYGRLMPNYALNAFWPGSELLFYMASAFLAIVLLRWRYEITLLISVFCALLAFTAQHTLPPPAAEHVALYFMMLAAGLVDVFVLAFGLSFHNALRAYGLTAATLVAGIAAGHQLSSAIAPNGSTLNLLALAALNLAVFTLFLHPAIQETVSAPLSMPPTRLPETVIPPAVSDAPHSQSPLPIRLQLPDSLSRLLSEQECEVLAAVLQHHPYKQIAARMNISESSVKTYVQRIYRKTGVFRRSQLLALINDAQNTPPPHQTTD